MRFPADADVFPTLAEWRNKHNHLSEWMMRQRHKSYNQRDDYYLKTAARLAQSCSRMVIEHFKISKVTEKPTPEIEKKGGNEARHNRTLAAASELRTALIQACSRHHCPMDIVSAVNNTKRCNLCGRLLDWDPAIELVRECPDCSTWDQDVNATDNIVSRVASGEVVAMVVPAKNTENGDFVAGTISTFEDARKRLRNTERSLTT
jgi:transposase